jgi:hypothetical protein
VATDGAAGSFNAPAVKTWWDARISIGPDGVNPVGEPHEFTALVEIKIGDANWTPAAGVLVTFDNDFGEPLMGTDTTGMDGKAYFTIVSYIAGTSTVNASARVTNDCPAEYIDVTTDGVAPNSGPAIKDWYYPEDDTIWAKLVDVNGSEDPNAIGFSGTGNWGWYNGPLSEGTYVFELWAGAAFNETWRGQLAGYLYLTYSGGCVTYYTDLEPGFAPKEGAHVYISYSDEAPRFTGGTGDFWNADFAGDSFCGYTGDIYFAFHSSVYVPPTD